MKNALFKPKLTHGTNYIKIEEWLCKSENTLSTCHGIALLFYIFQIGSIRTVLSVLHFWWIQTIDALLNKNI